MQEKGALYSFAVALFLFVSLLMGGLLAFVQFFVDHRDERFPRVAFFSARKILGNATLRLNTALLHAHRLICRSFPLQLAKN